jgi:hypothetical protein
MQVGQSVQPSRWEAPETALRPLVRAPMRAAAVRRRSSESRHKRLAEQRTEKENPTTLSFGRSKLSRIGLNPTCVGISQQPVSLGNVLRCALVPATPSVRAPSAPDHLRPPSY